MNEHKHTPGPWPAYLPNLMRASWEEPKGDTPVVKAGDVQIARLAYAASTDRETRNANARLIAAAPTLLEALREFVCSYDKENGTALHLAYDGARAAIAKAEGRT